MFLMRIPHPFRSYILVKASDPEKRKNQSQDHIQDQSKHEPHAKRPVINESLWGKIERPAALSIWEIFGACLRLGLEELRVEFQESWNSQSYQNHHRSE